MWDQDTVLFRLVYGLESWDLEAKDRVEFGGEVLGAIEADTCQDP